MNMTTIKSSIIALAACAALVACDDVSVGTTDASGLAPATQGDKQSSGAGVSSGSSNRKVVQAMNICLDNFPNMLKVRNELRTSSFTSEIRRGSTEHFSAFNRNVFAFASTGTNEPSCGFGRTGLRDDEAVAVAKDLLRGKYGSSFYEFDFSDEDGWLAAFYAKTGNGTEVDIFVRRQISIAGLYRGSLIYVYEHTEPEE